MATLLCFGFGYCAEYFSAAFGESFDGTIGTVRGKERAAILSAYAGGPRALLFDGAAVSPELKGAIAQTHFVLVSAPPGDSGDPVLAACRADLAAAQDLRAVVYLSTIGVYGDRDGAWVDEQSLAMPVSPRGNARLAAEQAWQDFGAQHGVAVAILRLAGIYGPGQNALVQIARSNARRVVKPGQIFNRIHVADIAQAIDAAFAQEASGIYNIADDEPSPPSDPLAFAAELMGVAPPPEIPFAEAAVSMSPIALSFWQECRRVRNDKLKRELGVALRYPTYREGLRALWEEGRQ
ncbi:MAG: NAD-dependent epimerase/dehydratase family protein [Xanthobacteraceae bacterium]